MLFLFGSSPMKCEDQYQCEINSSVDYVEISHEVKHLQSIMMKFHAFEECSDYSLTNVYASNVYTMVDLRDWWFKVYSISN